MRGGNPYKEAGTILLELVEAARGQGNLVDAAGTQASKARMRAIVGLKRRFRGDTVSFAAAGRRVRLERRREFLSHGFTTNWDELLRVSLMCNDFGNRIPYDDYLRAFSQTRIPARWPRPHPILSRATISGRPTPRPSSARPKTGMNSPSCAGDFRPQDQKERP